MKACGPSTISPSPRSTRNMACISTRPGWIACAARRCGCPSAARPRWSPPTGWSSPIIIACATAPRSFPAPASDYVKDGFQVAKREDEKLCPGMQAEILGAISDVTDRVTKAAAGKTGQDFVKARDAEIARGGEGRLRRQGGQIPLPGDHPLSRRPVQALHLSQIFRCPAGVRAGRPDRLLRRRSRQFQLSPLRSRLLLRAALRERQAGQARRII